MGTQLDASVGLSVAETTFGTPVTVTKFYEYLEETFDAGLTYTQGEGYRVGSRFPRSTRRALSLTEANGDLTIEACAKGMGALFKAALGTVTTTQRATTGVYQQVHTPAASDFLSSYTLQKGVPILGAGTQAYTFPGSVCSGFELSCPNGDRATLRTSWISRECRTDISYAAPSYVSETGQEVFTFKDAALTIGGTVTMPTTTALATGGTAANDVRELTVTFSNNLDTDGNNIGSAGKRSRKPAITGFADPVTGSMTAEFDATTLADAYLNNTSLALVLTFTGTTVIGTGSDTPVLQVVLPDVRLDGEVPKTGGGGVVTQSINFRAMDNTVNSPITVVYVSNDTAP